MKLHKKRLGELRGKAVHEFSLTNEAGIVVSCIEYGCAITRLCTPDRHGVSENIVLGYEHWTDYRENPAYFGVVVGRVAGRIRNAEFELNDQSYLLFANDGVNHLHGGVSGFSHAIWRGEPFETADCVGVRFSHRSVHGEDGYPGTLAMTVSYELDRANCLRIRYEGSSDQPTLLNPTNHSYFNLSGDGKRDILDHELQIDSSRFLELDEELLPTGRMLPVTDSPFDFRKPRALRTGANDFSRQNELAGNGYDHPFLFDPHGSHRAVLRDPASGRTLTLESDAQAVVVYSGNQLHEAIPVYRGKARKYLGICLETQGLPDSIHHPDFVPCILAAQQPFVCTTSYRFGVQP